MSFCLRPILMPNGLINVCNKCYNCRTTQRNIWTFRMLKELLYNDTSKFVTLTYKDECLPSGRTSPKFRDKYGLKYGQVFPVLVPSHLSDYHARFQKLLKKHNQPLARFYSIGEYGDLFNRPHYHEILYTHLPNDGTFEQMVEDAWKCQGITDFEDVNTANVVYCAKHQFKVSDGTPAQNAYQPIFQTMSRYNGGIGSAFFKQYANIICQKTFKGFNVNGFHIPTPPYYKKLARGGRNLTDDEMEDLIQRNFLKEKSMIDYFHQEFPHIVTRRDLVSFFYHLNLEKFHNHTVKRKFKIHCKKQALSHQAFLRNTSINNLIHY